MSRRKRLLTLLGTVILLLSLAVPMMQCALSPGEEVTPPSEEEEITPPAEEEEVTPPAEEGEIKYGGRFNVGWAPGACLENLRLGQTWQYTAMGCDFWPVVYDQLWIMAPAPDFDPLPMLATSWETEDGQTWIFHLRDDATWQDGVPVTAEDVAFSVEYLPTADPSWCFSDTLTEAGSVKVIDTYTVQFTLRTALGGEYPAFGWCPILPKHIWEPYKDNMSAFDNAEAIGSGPFKVKEFKSAEYVWFEANRDYWDDEIPYVDEMVYKSYGSFDALYMAMEKGEIDMIGYDYCSPVAAEDFKAKGFTVIECPGIGMYWLSFNLHKEGPIQDLVVRQAIMYAMDKDKMIDMVFLGHGSKSDSWIYPELAEHNPNLPQYDFDVNKANALLDGAGYVDSDGDGIRNDPTTGKNMEFSLIVTSTWSSAVKMATLIKEMLGEVSIGIDMLVLDLNTFYAYLYAPQNDMYDIGFSEEEPGPNGDWIWEFARSFADGGGGWNTSYYDNPAFDEALNAMTAERDPEKRKELVMDMQMMIAEDLPYGLLVRTVALDPVSDKFEGYVEGMGLSPWINPWTFFKVHLK